MDERLEPPAAGLRVSQQMNSFASSISPTSATELRSGGQACAIFGGKPPLIVQPTVVSMGRLPDRGNRYGA